VIVKRGQAKTHVKWRPVGPIKMIEVEKGYRITFKEIGMLTGQEIFQKGFDKIEAAAHRQPINLFSHPLVPSNIQ
ncbi:MAG: hypothetical protein ABIQ41_12485, partial [Gemmatimonadales bacterium]